MMKARRVRRNAEAPPVVCAWCQTPEQRATQSPGQSHGICPKHYAEQVAAIAGLAETENSSGYTAAEVRAAQRAKMEVGWSGLTEQEQAILKWYDGRPNPGKPSEYNMAKKKNPARKPSAKQLKARRNFVKMAKARGKAARARNAAKRVKPKTKPKATSRAWAHGPRKANKSRKIAGRRRNQEPDALGALFGEFQGRAITSESLDVVPASAPDDLVEIGALVRLKTTRETISWNENEGVKLAADARRRLWIIGPYAPFESGADLGEALRISYVTFKPHLDETEKEYFHDFGEDGGARPRVKTDADGRLKLVGGDYDLGWRGIED